MNPKLRWIFHRSFLFPPLCMIHRGVPLSYIAPPLQRRRVFPPSLPPPSGEVPSPARRKGSPRHPEERSDEGSRPRRKPGRSSCVSVAPSIPTRGKCATFQAQPARRKPPLCKGRGTALARWRGCLSPSSHIISTFPNISCASSCKMIK